MKKLLTIISVFIALATIPGACVKEEQYEADAVGSMEALWTIMDEHYCFFSEKKKELGVDWDEVHKRYRSQVKNTLSRYQLFEVLTNMLGELRDGHVNLSSPFDYGREWSWKEEYPSNFSDSIHRKYIGTDYRLTSGLEYRKLDDNSGYVYCSTFSNDFGNGNLDEIFFYLAPCQRIIIDVRNNGGGMLSAAEKLASRFTNEKLLVGYMQHKTGKGHDDFSSMEPTYLKPANGLRWQKQVYVLTNRSTFSAANAFVSYMKAIGNAFRRSGGKEGLSVTIVGDRTGGGGGLPFSSELPNGWGVRFSACPSYDDQGNSIESGVAPDIKVDITSEDYNRGIDTILETARKNN